MEKEQIRKMAEQVKKNMQGKRYLDFDDCWGYRRKQG